MAQPTTGSHLTSLMANAPWTRVETWLRDIAPDVLMRAERLRAAVMRSPGLTPDQPVAIRRADAPRYASAPAPVCPGDAVALCPAPFDDEPAWSDAASASGVMDLVWPTDLVPHTKAGQFLYLPAAWRIRLPSAQAYLASLTPARQQILADGELARIHAHRPALLALQEHVEQLAAARGLSHGPHGPPHWMRVARHAVAVSRSIGADNLVPVVFALVHDCQRENDGEDPEHGDRAAQFVVERRADLFSFLSDDEVAQLAMACARHSLGETASDRAPVLQAAFDSDRLDLGRVGIEPSPAYLSTPYACQEHEIAHAKQLVSQDDFVLREIRSHGFSERLWHGTTASFDHFDLDNMLGAHFGTYAAASDRLDDTGRLNDEGDLVEPMEFEISYSNALELPDLGRWTFQAMARALRQAELIDGSGSDALYDAYNLSDAEGWRAIKRVLQDAGYDAIRYRNEVEDAGSWSLIALKADQIESLGSAPAAWPAMRG